MEEEGNTLLQMHGFYILMLIYTILFITMFLIFPLLLEIGKKCDKVALTLSRDLQFPWFFSHLFFSLQMWHGDIDSHVGGWSHPVERSGVQADDLDVDN